MSKVLIERPLLELLRDFCGDSYDVANQVTALLNQPVSEGLEVVAKLTVAFDEGDEGSAIELVEIHRLIDEHLMRRRDARIGELDAERNDPEFPPKYARRLIDQLRAELAELREGVPAGVTRQRSLRRVCHVCVSLPRIEFCDACDNAAPVAKQVVMPEREGGHAQKSFWAGFEVARMRPDESNIRAAWNEFKSSDQFVRLNAADQEGDA